MVKVIEFEIRSYNEVRSNPKLRAAIQKEFPKTLDTLDRINLQHTHNTIPLLFENQPTFTSENTDELIASGLTNSITSIKENPQKAVETLSSLKIKWYHEQAQFPWNTENTDHVQTQLKQDLDQLNALCTPVQTAPNRVLISDQQAHFQASHICTAIVTRNLTKQLRLDGLYERALDAARQNDDVNYFWETYRRNGTLIQIPFRGSTPQIADKKIAEYHHRWARFQTKGSNLLDTLQNTTIPTKFDRLTLSSNLEFQTDAQDISLYPVFESYTSDETFTPIYEPFVIQNLSRPQDPTRSDAIYQYNTPRGRRIKTPLNPQAPTIYEALLEWKK
jgi:flagellin-like hook-associated protein FlgL